MFTVQRSTSDEAFFSSAESRRPTASHDLSVSFRERAVTFESGGLRLVGVLSEPSTGGRPGNGTGAVLIHGWGSYRAGPHGMLVKMARALAAAGVPALRFDLRGRGDSEGEYAETDLDGMIDDAVAAGTWLRETAGCVRLAAVGVCSGGNVAIGAATRLPAFERIVAVSTLPFQSHKKASQERRRTLAALGTYARKVLRRETWARLFRGEINFGLVRKVISGGEGGTAKTADSAARNLKDSKRDLVSAFAKYGGEVLFVYGGADAEGDEGRRHYEALCAEHGIQAQFHVIEGANHNYYALAWERELLGLTSRFVPAS